MKIKEVEAEKFIELAEKKLKKYKELSPPNWAKFAKTGSHTKFPPHDDDWWYTRAASIVRKLEINPYLGVSRLRTIYGGKKERGHKPERFRKAGGNHIRKILQQLESAGLVETKNEGVKRGRFLTEEGKKFVGDVISEVKK
jgi:small subunit ribosomal protein S19e